MLVVVAELKVLDMKIQGEMEECVSDPQTRQNRLKEVENNFFMFNKDIYKHASPEDLHNLCYLSFTIRKMLLPVDFLMKICGLTYGSSCPLITHIGTKHKIQRTYTVLVAVFVIISSLRYIPSVFVSRKYPQFIKYEYLLWHGKCAVQALYCIFICCRYGRKISHFQSLISEFDAQLERYKDTYNKEAKKRYERNAKVICISLFAAVVVTMILIGLSIFLPTLANEKLHAALFEPFIEPNLPLKFLFFLSYFYLTVAWLLPVIIYCHVCLSFCLILDQFHASLNTLECNKVNKRIKYVRDEFQLLRRLVSYTDDVIGFMALCVYCLDVILCCFHLFHCFFHVINFVEKLGPAFRALVSLANLFAMSFCAAKVAEKVRHTSFHFIYFILEHVP